ncbi:glycine--tRNA ligase subunit beta, partial [Litorivicinus sp.]|nr:glycine--tRNA ligase subunit beta [Litorivicinus sp.]
MSYLFELGCEELPSSGLPEMAAQLKINLDQELKKARLGFDSIEIIAGPRRLGAKINGLAAFSSAVAIEKRGPAVVAAYQEGEPTKALQGFCKGLGIDVDDVATIETEKGHWV